MSDEVVVTGAAGFIGSHLCDWLLSQGFEVMGLDNLSSGRRENLVSAMSSDRFRFRLGDVRDRALVSEIVGGAGAVVHCAAIVGVHRVLADPSLTLEVNYEGSRAVIDACARSGARLVLLSSSEVYGRTPSLPQAEDLELSVLFEGPRDSYPTSKILAERYCAFQGVNSWIVRLFNTTGPRQGESSGMVVPRLVSQARRGLPLTVYGDGAQTRSFCHVADTVDAIGRMLSVSSTGPTAVNVGSDDQVEISQLADMVRTVVGARSPIRFVPRTTAFGTDFPDYEHRVPDVSRALRMFGWRAHLSLPDIIRDVVSHDPIG